MLLVSIVPVVANIFSQYSHSCTIQFIKMVLELIILILLFLITNFNFTMFHLYMRKKPESSNRLLNVLYSFHAFLLQFGSFLILLCFCDIKKHEYRYFDTDIYITEVLITIRRICLSCVFINNVYVGMATVIQNFKMDFYLLISLRLTKKIICTTTFFISILFNIFVKFSLKVEEIDKHQKYQWLTERVCIWSNILPMAMFLVVILRDMIFTLKKHSIIFWEHWRDYFLRRASTATTIFTIEMEMGHDAIIVINNNSGNEECIRLE